MSGGDFISRSEAAVCQRRRIDDRVAVTRDLRRVVKHLGAAVAADQLGLPVGEIDRIEARKVAISPALLTALYGPGGAKLLPALVPADGVDAGVAKIMAVLSARPAAEPCSRPYPLPPLVALHEPPPAPAPRAVPTKPPTAAEAAVLHATLKRAVVVCGGTKKAAEAIGIGWSTIGFLLGKQKPITAATAEKVRAWDAANPPKASTGDEQQDAVPPAGGDAGADAVTGAAEEAPPPETAASIADAAFGWIERLFPEQNSTPAAGAAALPPAAVATPSGAGVEGAAVSPRLTPPPSLAAVPVAANDDPFAEAATVLLRARDAATAARLAVADEMSALEAQIVPIETRLQELRRADKKLLDRWGKLDQAIYDLQRAAK